jgi:hypothetical protein
MSPTVLPRRYARRPRRKLRSHDSQRESRKLSANAVALCSRCAHHFPHYTAQAAAYATLARLPMRITYAEHDPHCTAQALRAKAAAYVTLAQSSTRTSRQLSFHACARLVRITPPTILPMRCARRPQRTLRPHYRQRASRKLSAHAVALCSPCAHHVLNYTSQALHASAFVFLSTFLIG